MHATLSIDELGIDPDPIARALHTVFKDESHTEFATDLASVDRLALVADGGVSRDHEDAGNARKIGRQRLSDAVDEGIVLCIAADVDEGQDH
jgi:hypothetical protein